jgi:hypothetical protein
MSNIILPKKLGKRGPRIDTRTLKLSKYLTPKLPPPPVRMGYVDKVQSWPMFLNDTLGDCVIAAAGHMIQQWTTYASSGAPVILSDQEILLGYERVGGYVPGDPSTDNGCDMLTALNYWKKIGFGGHKIGAYVSVDYTNRTEVKTAMWLFGNVYIGVALPASAQDPTQTGKYPCWQVPKYGPTQDGSPGTWGGHAIPAVGYSDDKTDPGTEVITWGSVYDMTWNFLDAYCDEMWAVLSPDWVSKVSAKAPNGFKVKSLQDDLMAVSGKPRHK